MVRERCHSTLDITSLFATRLVEGAVWDAASFMPRTTTKAPDNT